jgi:hydroxyacylglutathione hydrolase
MKIQTREGPALLSARPPLREFPAAELAGRIGRDLSFIDTRPAAVYNEQGVEGALQVPAGRKFATYASYAINPAEDPRGLILLASGEQQALELRDRLAYVGIDNVTGYTTALEGLDRTPAPVVTPAELEELPDALVLDVRTAAEHADGNVPGSRQLHVGRILGQRDSFADDRPIVVYCQSGARATVAASALRLAGLDARELAGNYPAWKAHQQLAEDSG